MDVTHFSMVGFVYEGDAQTGVGRLARRQLSTCRPKPLGGGNISCVVHDPSGAELWISLHRRSDGQTEVISMNPAFDGEGRAKLHIAGDNSDPDWAPFEVSRAARFAGEETPLVVDLANPEEASKIPPGGDVTVSIAAFSFEPSLFVDADAFAAAQRKAGNKIALAPNFFLPSGMLFERVGGALPEDAKRPTAYADFAGTVLKARLRRNAAGGAPFWWVLAQTYGAITVDVVIDPATIKVEPKPGNIITGRFWMSARIAPSP